MFKFIIPPNNRGEFGNPKIVRGPWKGGMLVPVNSIDQPGIYRVVKKDGHRPRFFGIPLEAMPWLLVGWMC